MRPNCRAMSLPVGREPLDPASWWGEAVADPVSLMLDDLTSRYAETLASETFARLYTDDSHFGHVFLASTND